MLDEILEIVCCISAMQDFDEQEKQITFARWEVFINSFWTCEQSYLGFEFGYWIDLQSSQTEESLQRDKQKLLIFESVTTLTGNVERGFWSSLMFLLSHEKKAFDWRNCRERTTETVEFCTHKHNSCFIRHLVRTLCCNAKNTQITKQMSPLCNQKSTIYIRLIAIAFLWWKESRLTMKPA